MARTITQYRIFIGPPGGLVAERRLFRDTVTKFNQTHARQHQIEFEAVGWEDTLPGCGRPQEKINEDLEQCDYAIFAFHDQWGSPTGNDGLVGTEEEWQVAQRLYAEYKLRQMALFFKAVPPAQDKDPGEEYKKVLAFKRQIFDGKKHLCGLFKTPRGFGDMVEKHLAQWLADHIRTPIEGSLSERQSQAEPKTAAIPVPTFAYWYDEAWKVMEEPSNDYLEGIIFASRAVDAASDANELSWALHAQGYAHFNRGDCAESLTTFQLQIEALAGVLTEDADERIAKALFNKGLSLSRLDRREEAIATFDELIKNYDNIDAKPLREQVVKALIWKARELSVMKQIALCIAALEAWAEKRGSFDCDEVADDVFFKRIRDDPEFAAYLASKGCVTE